MTIEIRKPELETLIRERMQTGRFSSVEEVLLEALRFSPSSIETTSSEGPQARTGADLIAALQASPCKEIDLEPQRDRLPVRDVAF
jgi:Arc/MetJ-type ribon-helix-helix transcriptional regulator